MNRLYNVIERFRQPPTMPIVVGSFLSYTDAQSFREHKQAGNNILFYTIEERIEKKCERDSSKP